MSARACTPVLYTPSDMAKTFVSVTIANLKSLKLLMMRLRKPVWLNKLKKMKLMLYVDQMSLKAPTVKLIKYQWFVFSIVLRLWLQDKNEGQTCCTKACGEQPPNTR